MWRRSPLRHQMGMQPRPLLQQERLDPRRYVPCSSPFSDILRRTSAGPRVRQVYRKPAPCKRAFALVCTQVCGLGGPTLDEHAFQLGKNARAIGVHDLGKDCSKSKAPQHLGRHGHGRSMSALLSLIQNVEGPAVIPFGSNTRLQTCSPCAQGELRCVPEVHLSDKAGKPCAVSGQPGAFCREKICRILFNTLVVGARR